MMDYKATCNLSMLVSTSHNSLQQLQEEPIDSDTESATLLAGLDTAILFIS